MADIILDTNILADLLAQYFQNQMMDKQNVFYEENFINKNIAREINKIVAWHEDSFDTSISFPGLVIASTFAFVEISRKFDEISNSRYNIFQFGAFIENHPEWFFIAPVDNNLFHLLANLPREVSLGDDDSTPVEWADAIHVATAEARDEPWLLAATDQKIQAIPCLFKKII